MLTAKIKKSEESGSHLFFNFTWKYVPQLFLGAPWSEKMTFSLKTGLVWFGWHFPLAQGWSLIIGTCVKPWVQFSSCEEWRGLWFVTWVLDVIQPLREVEVIHPEEDAASDQGVRASLVLGAYPLHLQRGGNWKYKYILLLLTLN